MSRFWLTVLLAVILGYVSCVKQKYSFHSDEESSINEDYVPKKNEGKNYKEDTKHPYVREKHKKTAPDVEDVVTTEKGDSPHPNELFFPLIYKQTHVDSMFKFGDEWYTWSIEKRTDGTTVVNYYVCNDDPKKCDELGWERIEFLPKCAFQIDSLVTGDKICINAFGVEPKTFGMCEGDNQVKISEITRTCGPRIRSMWRFVRTSKRFNDNSKAQDINSLVCYNEEECFVNIEYRIHHDRITYSLHEQSRGQTFKSVLNRDSHVEPEGKPQEHSEKKWPKTSSKHLDHKKAPSYHAKSKGDQEGARKTTKTKKTKNVAAPSNFPEEAEDASE